MNNYEVSSQEEWKPIRETEGKYSVSNMGRVKNNETGTVLKANPIGRGYLKVNLHLKGMRVNRLVHRLVAIEFIDNPENKPEVNHKNGVHQDNRLCNLEWMTGEENRKHAYDTGLVRHKDDRYSGYLYQLWKNRYKTQMCTEWRDYLKFYDWCYQQGYNEGQYVCRYNIQELYSPENCYLGEDIQKNLYANSILYDCFGEKMTITEIAQRYDITVGCLTYRIKKGLSVEEAITMKKTKPKDNRLVFRVSDSMYSFLIEQAQESHITVSDYLRRLIEENRKNAPEKTE